MKQQRTDPLRWVRLDNAAKIYPAARRQNWSSIFRESVTLWEPVDTQLLQSALDATVPRFPSIAARLRRGVFWYYLQQMEAAPRVQEERSYPLTHMSKAEIRRCAFRVIAYHDRIAVEFFHALTDGNGALVFLKSLVAEYLEQKHGIRIPFEQGVLDRREPPAEEELEDCFPRCAGAVRASRRGTDAWRLSGQPQEDGFLHLTCFRLPVRQVLEQAHRHNATATVFLSAILMRALLELQNEKQPDRRLQKRIKLLIPVNLRKLFPCRTLRNFAMYSIPELDPRLGDYTFDEICAVIRHKLGAEVTAKHMSTMIATNVGSERNPLVRLIPLPLKNLVMKAVFDRVGERRSCLSMSNLGQVQVPDGMARYIRRFDFILGIQLTAPYNCGVVSYGDTVYVNFIRNVRDGELEQRFFAVARELGIPVTVESNRNER